MKMKAGKMTQWIRALAALPENLDSIPSTHMAAHNCSMNNKNPETDMVESIAVCSHAEDCPLVCLNLGRDKSSLVA